MSASGELVFVDARVETFCTALGAAKAPLDAVKQATAPVASAMRRAAAVARKARHGRGVDVDESIRAA